MRTKCTGTIHVPLAPDDALTLFTPEGERAWVPGWNPAFPEEAADETAPGTTFTTDHGGAHTFWVVADRKPDAMRYARVTPGVYAGTVEVRCEPDGAATRAHVTYDLTALGDPRRLDEFTAGYEAMLAEWERLIRAAC